MGLSYFLLAIALHCLFFGAVGCYVWQSGGKGSRVVADAVAMIQNSNIFPDDKKFLCRVAWVESRYGTHPNTYRRGYYGGIWQVDRIGYIDTVRHPGARRFHGRIKLHFGIDWARTSWHDLRTPLYSGLAARLFLVKILAAIPSSLSGQANYWKRYYNTVAGAGTVQKFINDVNRAYGCAV